jgi:hypothetical protein
MEVKHAAAVDEAARAFVKNPAFKVSPNAIVVPPTLYSVSPLGNTGGEREIPIADIATDRIRGIIAY